MCGSVTGSGTQVLQCPKYGNGKESSSYGTLVSVFIVTKLLDKKYKSRLIFLYCLPLLLYYFWYASLLLHAQQHMNELLLTCITKQRVALLSTIIISIGT